MTFFRTVGLLFSIVGGAFSVVYLVSLARKKMGEPHEPLWRFHFVPTLMFLIASSYLCRVVADASTVDRMRDGVWTLVFLALGWAGGFASLRRLRIGETKNY